jgi:hypothetical protein
MVPFSLELLLRLCCICFTVMVGEASFISILDTLMCVECLKTCSNSLVKRIGSCFYGENPRSGLYLLYVAMVLMKVLF